MKRHFVIRPEAADEVAEAREWYERRALGLGNEFFRSFEACLASIQRHPEAYPLVHREIRRALLRRFPFSILYSTAHEETVVLACFHTKRDPSRWKERR